MILWKCIKEALLRHPKQVVCEQQAQMSYEELAVFAECFAHKIAGEQCCVIMCTSEMAAAMALLSCFAAGVTAIPLSTRYGEIHCNKILDMISPTAVITDMNGELGVIYLSNPGYVAPPGHPALIMCTSGTTGQPKGAMLSEKNILTNVRDVAAYLQMGEEDAILIARPLYHCAVLTGEFLTSLMKGTKIRFCSEPFNPQMLLNLIAEHNITVFCGTPTLLSMLARFQGKRATSSLKVISVSGECMGAETGQQILSAFPDADIYHVYGLTEACPRVSYLPPNLFKEHPDSVGIPLNTVSVRIITADGKKAKNGEAGELWVRGGNVMLGYYNAPDLTEKVLKGKWLRTGDMAVIDKNGLLKIKGRCDDLIIRAGMNVYPQEIEGALKADARVREVLAFGVPSRRTGMRIGIKIAGDFADADEVKQLCMELLPSFQVPSIIELVDELPKNGSGKIMRGEYYAGV